MSDSTKRTTVISQMDKKEHVPDQTGKNATRKLKIFLLATVTLAALTYYAIITSRYHEALLKELDSMKRQQLAVEQELDVLRKGMDEFSQDTDLLDRGELTDERILLIFGLDDYIGRKPKMINEVFRIGLDNRKDVTALSTLPFEVPTESAACVVGDAMYAVGVGVLPGKELWRVTKSGDWQRLSDVPWQGLVYASSDRGRYCLAVVKSKIYVLGGWIYDSSSAAGEVFVYDTLTNTWSTAGKLYHAVDSAACVSYDNSIYLFGGSTEYEDVVSYVQKYDPVDNVSSLMKTPLPNPHTLLKTVLVNKSVILFGNSTCLIYDLDEQTWQERNQFKTGLAHFALVLYHDRIYIAGGGVQSSQPEEKDEYNCQMWSNTDEIKSVPVADIIYNRPAVWKLHSKLPHRGLVYTFSLFY